MKDEDLLMEDVETNYKNDDKSDEVVNENVLALFAAGSSVVRSDSDSDNECESEGRFFFWETLILKQPHQN